MFVKPAVNGCLITAKMFLFPPEKTAACLYCMFTEMLVFVIICCSSGFLFEDLGGKVAKIR